MIGSKTRLIVCCLTLACLLFGCSYASVGHLRRQPWILDTPQELEMRFWTFSFVAEFSEGHYVLKGIAEPRGEALPEGVAWIDDLWLAAYLSDDRGRVLAQDILVYSALPLEEGQGVSFSFTLKPDQLSRSAPLEVTFGYNMTLTPHKEYKVGDPPKKTAANGKSGVFFAHEGALTRI